MRGSKRRMGRRIPVALTVSALVMVMVLLLSGAALAAPPWSDAPNSWWVATYQLTDQEIGTVGEGYPDGTFRPQLDVTREQFAKMVVDGMGLPTATPPVPTFRDVPATSFFYPWIEGGAAARIISGFTDGSFGPKNNIVRQQANSILGSYLAQKELNLRGHIAGDRANYPSLNTWYLAEGMAIVAAFADNNRVASVHAPATAYLVFRNVVQGSYSGGAMYLGPNNNLTRAQAAALIMRVKRVQFSTALPTVTQLTPANGPAAGGNTVVITGTNFTDVVSILFGSTGVGFIVNSSTQITVTAPSGTIGTTVDVVVTTAAGDSAKGAGSKYTYEAPVVTSLAPNAGPSAGGNQVVITGTASAWQVPGLGRFVGEPGIVQVPGAPRFVSGCARAGRGAYRWFGSPSAALPSGSSHDALQRPCDGRSATRRSARLREGRGPVTNQRPGGSAPCGGLTGINGVRHPSG